VLVNGGKGKCELENMKDLGNKEKKEEGEREKEEEERERKKEEK
jgi:hypothetical protein